MSVLAISFPNPISWVWDKAGGLLGDAAGAALGWSFEKVIGGLVAWVLDGVAWVVGAVFGFIDSSTSPTVTAAWFVGDGSREGPYRMMLSVAAALLLLFVFAGLIQGVLAGDVAGMGRRIVLDLPLAIGGMVSTVAITQLLIDLTDALSDGILSGFGADIRAFMDGVATVGSLTGGVATALVVFLLGLFTLLAGLVIFIELVIRSALIYLVVGLCPLAFAALMWPVTRGVLRKTLELLCALIVSKVVISLALAIGAAALGGAGSAPTAAPEIAPPGATASAGPAADESDAATVTAAAGVLLAGLATFAVACFSPFVILRLFPVVEGAIVAQGLRSGPLRGAQSAWSMKYQMDVSRRFGSGSFRSAGGEGEAGAASETAARGGATGAAPATASAAGPAVVAVAATGAATSATRAARNASERQADAAVGSPASRTNSSHRGDRDAHS
jgi:type IV secretion system protein TrbL